MLLLQNEKDTFMTRNPGHIKYTCIKRGSRGYGKVGARAGDSLRGLEVATAFIPTYAPSSSHPASSPHIHLYIHIYIGLPLPLSKIEHLYSSRYQIPSTFSFGVRNLPRLSLIYPSLSNSLRYQNISATFCRQRIRDVNQRKPTTPNNHEIYLSSSSLRFFCR